MKQISGKKFAKGGLFAVIVLLMIALLSAVFVPTYYAWSQDNSSKGVYKTPANRIQVTFLGTSQVGVGISPMELYEDYGICANLVASGGQPMIASYYWLQEVYRRNRKSLKTVVVDASGLFYDNESRDLVAATEKSLAGMRLSMNKIRAMRELEKRYEGVSALDNLVPVFRYHSRWTSLERDDYTGVTDCMNYFYTMGYTPFYRRSLDEMGQKKIDVINYSITDEIDTDASLREEAVDAEGAEALRMISDFCSDNNLDLVLIKIPREWTDVEHDALKEMAAELDVPLLDMNTPVALEQMGLVFSTDYMHMQHANIYGARKLTGYVGQFLSEHYRYDDVRGDRRYSFMEEYAELYDKLVEDAQIQTCTDLSEYLEKLISGTKRYQILISVRGDGAAGLSQAAREQFAQLGFTELSELQEGTHYAGVSDGGTILADETAWEEDIGITAYGLIDGKKLVPVDTVDPADPDLTGMILKDPDSGQFRVTSAETDGAQTAAIWIGDEDYSPNKEGINIVVRNKEIGCIIDTVNFETHTDSARTSDTGNLKTYERRVTESRLGAVSSSEEYFAVLRETDGAENYITLICENPFSDSGQTQNRFAAVGSSGTIREEMVGGGETLREPSGQFSLLAYSYSVSEDPGADSQLVIGTSSYSVSAGHMLVLTYDTCNNWLVAQRTFELPK